MQNNNHKMIGKCTGVGPGGRNCPCCGDAPGRNRKVARRAAKRAERRNWKAEVAA